MIGTPAPLQLYLEMSSLSFLTLFPDLGHHHHWAAKSVSKLDLKFLSNFRYFELGRVVLLCYVHFLP